MAIYIVAIFYISHIVRRNPCKKAQADRCPLRLAYRGSECAIYASLYNPAQLGWEAPRPACCMIVGKRRIRLLPRTNK